MRLGVAAGDEERLALLFRGLADESDGLVGILLLADVAGLIGAPAVGVPAVADQVLVARPHFADAVIRDQLGAAPAALDPLAVLLVGDVGGLEVPDAGVAPPLPAAEVPGVAVLDAGVEDLSGDVGRVAVFLEIHREAVPLRMICAPPGRVVIDAGGDGTVSGEHRRPGRPGEGILAVIVLEEHAAPGEGIEVGGVHLRGAVGFPVGAHVVRHDEQDVHPGFGFLPAGSLGLRGLDGGRSGEQAQGDGNDSVHRNGRVVFL